MTHSLLDDRSFADTLRRIELLAPDRPALWGRMNAPRVIVHLGDQMRHTLGDVPCAPRPGPLRNAVVRWLAIYVVPWPKGRLKGPPEAFATTPGAWDADVRELVRLVERFRDDTSDRDWPEHALLGPMTRNDWGAFCYKHFDHHLRQFGA